MDRSKYPLIAISALLLLVIAVALEHPFVHRIEASDSVIFNIGAFASIAKELAFALIIALVVILIVEESSRRHGQRLVDEHRAQLEKDLFVAVFSRTLPPDYVKVAVDINLEPALIRRYLNLYYTIEQIPQHMADNLPGAHDDYILLVTRMEFSIQNPNAYSVEQELTLTNPHLIGYMDEYSKIDELSIGDTLESVSCKKDSVITEETEEQTIYKWPIQLNAGGKKYVVISSTLLKDASDNHIFVSTRPTLSAKIFVRINVPGLRVGLRSLTATPAMRTFISPDGSDIHWTVNGPSCPNDSFVLWWRDRQTDTAPIEDREAPTIDTLP